MLKPGVRLRNCGLVHDDGYTISAESLIEKIRNVSNALRAVSRLFSEHAADQFLHCGRNVRTKAAERRRRLVQVLMNERADRGVVERQRVGEHLEKHDA